MSSANRSRKYDSGSQKRKKNQRLDDLTQSQKRAMDRFIVKESQVSSNNHILNQCPALDSNVDNDPRDVDPQTENNVGVEEPDIFDPRYWDSLDTKQIDILAQKGPKRDLSIQKGPRGRYSRRFSALFYNRNYQMESIGQLANEGYNDWTHLGTRLTEHETSADHVLNMTTWYELRSRLQKDQTIDKAAQRQLEKEKDHWRKVLFRIICIVRYVAKHSLAFRGTNSKLYDDSNGNFLGLIEMLAEFDPFIQEHVRHITNEETHVHYLDHKIQNELIHMLALAIKSEIITKIKRAKYFSVILDCTPDASQQEQMSLIIRYVDLSSGGVCIEESFLGFIDVKDTTGQGLFDAVQNQLKQPDLDIDNLRGHGYDNGSNMKGGNKGVQKKFLVVNPRAFYSSCGCHSLNLTLCDMANNCSLANNELGVYEFIMALVIWYEVLYAINLVSKQLQAKDMLIDVAIEKVQGVISFFKGYRETGFLEALEVAKGIALDMDIGESFRISYFLSIVDQAISSLTTRFEQYQGYQKNFGFLFTSDELQSLDNQNFIPKENMGPVEILKFLRRHDCFPNVTIAYRVLLTIPVTVASAERNFSKLKLLKSYLPSTMTQERLNDLTMIALEKKEKEGVLEKIDCKPIIEDFISRNPTRMKLFQ
ncbi:hypothetical protein PVAP13_5NG361343 [Panicum virgatum]|uniref:Uncharacterized protein n=1 Tax=Panicum virgatum TaxID=38727 RepID=A0A8T0RU65_PANVG|nr:hypothetical protein PVAP13_5NG361343 [Panicum virgatum]